ncbi:hypothetical protein Bbelb_220050 [Branchiostoma belcheri]|nr:hypothetical protein Bbelb_220050 [Branchiostoma belcheri]
MPGKEAVKLYAPASLLTAGSDDVTSKPRTCSTHTGLLRDCNGYFLPKQMSNLAENRLDWKQQSSATSRRLIQSRRLNGYFLPKQMSNLAENRLDWKKQSPVTSSRKKKYAESECNGRNTDGIYKLVLGNERRNQTN